MDKFIFDLSFGRTLILENSTFQVSIPTYPGLPLWVMETPYRVAFDYVTSNVVGLTQIDDRRWIAHNIYMFQECRDTLKAFYNSL